jgi:hypothetical protein
MATPALIGRGAFAPHRISSLSSSQFCEEDGRERKVRGFKNQCALPQERERAGKKGEGLWSRLVVLNVEERNPPTLYLAAIRGCQTGVRVCGFCEGEGHVSSEAGERWRAGKAMRDARVKHASHNNRKPSASVSGRLNSTMSNMDGFL